jgi:hypothetical protein
VTNMTPNETDPKSGHEKSGHQKSRIKYIERYERTLI